jgi:hypothetical protein
MSGRVCAVVLNIILLLGGIGFFALGIKISQFDNTTCWVKSVYGTQAQADENGCAIYGIVTVLLPSNETAAAKAKCREHYSCPKNLTSSCDGGLYPIGKEVFCFNSFGVLRVLPSKDDFSGTFLFLMLTGIGTILAGLILLRCIWSPNISRSLQEYELLTRSNLAREDALEA